VGIKQQLADPWGIVASGVTGGMAGAMTAALAGIPAAIPVALGVAGLVYGVKVAVGALTERPQRAAELDLPMPARGSQADLWLRRAEKAVRTLHEQTESPRDPVTRAHIGDVDDQAAGTLVDLRRLAAQVAAVESAAARIDIRRLEAEQDRLAAAVRMAQDPALRAERERSAQFVTEQIQVHGRLLVVRDTLVARMQATAIGLEGLIARLAEVLALSATAGGVDTTAQRIADLAGDLDGMQAGLRETEALSQRVLAQGGQMASG
jgi:hypothetical protein